ncbi:MAG: adenylosuccinate lyase [Planctomycetota bacterium]
MKSSIAFEDVLATRYASPGMVEALSPERRIRHWRRVWIALAEAERELGLPITAVQIAELKRNEGNLNLAVAKKREKETRHDLMAHLQAFAVLCPKAGKILHLGATSALVTDNADLLAMREALERVRDLLAAWVEALARFAGRHADLACLGFTHLQPAQPTTVGKRACLWLQDLADDLCEVERLLGKFPWLGIKGTTGTQASFLALLGTPAKVDALERLVGKKLGFEAAFPVTGQTYPRKFDQRVTDVLAGIASSASRMSQDVRILQHMGELEEPFEAHQVGSSAMPYKRNPMLSERMAALSRYVLATSLNTGLTAAVQFLERTLDDSANRRIVIPDLFLATDGILRLGVHVSRGLQVFPRVIESNLQRELPFSATENILMEATKKGGDRQALHERIRVHAHAAKKAIRESGAVNDLIGRLRADPSFSMLAGLWDRLLDPARYVGLAPRQTCAFLESVVRPLLKRHPRAARVKVELEV